MKAWLAIVSVCLAGALGARADEVGASWQRVDKGESDRFTEICWDGPLAVAVGSRGLLGTSTDGKSWTVRFSGVQADLKDAVWNGSFYLALGSGGTIIKSTDGIDWQRIDAPAANDYQGVAWTGSQFIALDSYYYLSTSPDGIVWNRSRVEVDPPFATPLYGIEYFDGATYLRHNAGIARSTDLVNWTKVQDLSSYNIPSAIRKINGRFFSLGPSEAIRSSPDGITWTYATFVGPSSYVRQDLVDLAWNGSAYVAVGSSNRIWRSTDGLTWTGGTSAWGDFNYVRWINGEFVAGTNMREIQTSPDGKKWTKSGQYSCGNAIVWTGNRYISVGNYGFIATSSDFETWTTRDSGIHSNLQSLVWTGSFALAAAADGTILKSSDGLAWTKVAVGTFGAAYVRLVWTGTQLFAFSGHGTDISSDGNAWTRIATAKRQFYDVKWVRGLFIALGYSGELETSPDGVTWTLGTSDTTSHMYAAAASPDRYMVGGNKSTLLSSPDGITWTPHPPPAPVYSAAALEYRFGRWFLATTVAIYSSLDGITWDAVSGLQPLTNLADCVKLVWTGTELVCVGLDARTSDGIHWQQRQIRASGPDFKAVAKGPDGYVAIANRGVIWHSADGYAWQPVISSTTADLAALAASPERWVIVGSGGSVLSSTDGIQWTPGNSGTTKHLVDIVWSGSRFVATGDSGTILTSTDGLGWSTQPSGSPMSISNVEATASGFRAFGGSGSVFRSPDGLAWTSSVEDFMTDVVWNGSAYVAVARGPENSAWAYVSSPDALQWTRYPVGVTSFLTGLCWAGSLHVACGSNGTIVTSPDGIAWTPRASGTTQWIQGLTWNGTQLVAVGRAGTLLYSPDGITWTPGTMSDGSSFDYEDVAWADGRYVAVGLHNGSATSTDGKTWQPTWGINFTSRTVEKVGSRFLAAGSYLYSIASTSSTFGFNWSSASNYLNTEVYDLASNGNLLFATTTSGVYRLHESPAGQWNFNSRVYSSPWLDNMVCNGNEFVATGSSGTVVLSRDGTSWQTVRGGRDAAYSATAWSGSRFVGVASNRLETSPDGATWNSVPSPLGNANFTLTDVVWTGSRFVAVGPSATIFRSNQDAGTWTSIGDAGKSPPDMTGIAGDDEFLVTVGTGGMIAVSDGSGEAAGDYQSWISGQGAAPGSSAPLQDANADGISNLLAYIHGIPATGRLGAVERAALPAMSFASSTGGPVLTFELRESYRPGATYVVEVSSDLQSDSWQSVQRYSAGWATGPGQASITETPLPGGGVRITVSNFPQGESGIGCFFRLRASLP